MQKLFFLIILFLSFLASNSFAQQNNIDSLLSLLKKDKEDTNKVNHMNLLAMEFRNNNPDTAIYFGKQAMKLSEKTKFQKGISESNLWIGTSITNLGKYEEALSYLTRALSVSKEINYKKIIARTYNNIGLVYFYQGNFQEALKNNISSLKIKEEIGDKNGIANSYIGIGNIFERQGNYPEALKNHLASLKIKEAIGEKEGIAGSYNNIGNVYSNQGNYSEALKNHFASLKIMDELGNKKGIANSYNNIGLVYDYQGNYEEALKSHLASLKIKQEIGGEEDIARSYNNIGLVYYNLGNYSEALKNYFACLKIGENIGNRAGIVGSYINIGNTFAKQKKYKEAEVFLIKSKELSKEIGYKEILRNTYSGLAQLDSTKGDFKGAYENHKLYVLYRDSLDNEGTKKKTIQSQMTYDFEKKEAVADAEHKKELENQQALAEEKSRKQKVVILFVVIGFALVLVFAGFVFRSLRITRKQKDIIELQKKEVEQQKHLVEEHQKEIIDSITYAKRLQQAILPSNEEIKKYLPDSFILYKPKDIVAGDFYWLHTTSPSLEERGAGGEVIFIAAADSTGHGVPGAMVSVVCSNALNRAVNEFNLVDTGKILDKTRELVLETFAKSGEEIKDGMDISLLSINKSSKQINWSGANNPLWYLSLSGGENITLHELKPDKQSIGKTDNPKSFTTHTIKLNSGDIFYLMTDGYADQFGGEKGKKYKYKQLQEGLIANSSLSLAEQKEKLTHSFDNWKGNLEQVDDVTIIGIRG